MENKFLRKTKIRKGDLRNCHKEKEKKRNPRNNRVPLFFVKMGKMIGLSFDLKTDLVASQGDPLDLSAELDTPKTVEAIAQAVESGGHTVKRIGHVWNLLKNWDDLDVDIVFNICEGHLGRNRESQVPLLLEMKGIPYVGSDALTLGITLDKIVAKKCFIADRIPTPHYFAAVAGDNLRKLCKLAFPLIVKPHHEGSSKGLSKNSRVINFTELKKQVDVINGVYQQTALVEEFIKGTEFTVGVIGNEHPLALPVVQIAIEGKRELGDDFYTFTRLSQQTDQIQYLCPAQIPKRLLKTLQEIAVAAYKSVGCVDFGRIDFRVDEKGRPYVLEINPLPCLSPEDTFFFMAKAKGWTYAEIINRILDEGLKRYGLWGSRVTRKQSPVRPGETASV